ncbi:MAG: discoidin domain-containing protein [Candidatus Aminicenantes bacterium]|nr:discoidin domain-containing protein [Candidatus Aminicenantes bacterium]
MSKDTKIKLGALALFTIFTLIQLYPLSLHPWNSLNDTGDCTLNTWILSWVQHTVFNDPLHLFNANCFYPHPNSLSFSEHLFPQAMLSLPVRIIFQNPVLCYNILFLLAHILNAYGMFLLVRHLTKNNLAALVSGTMFGFTTFLLNHITHLQMVSCWMIPFALLYLHKFFEEKNTKNSLFFAIFFTLQGLACIYHGLFFISVLMVFIPCFFLSTWRKTKLVHFVKLGVPLVFSGAVLFLFSLPYLSLFETFGFKRTLSHGADLIHYLGATPRSVFFGKILTPLGASERYLFPGFCVLILTGLFFVLKRKLYRPIPRFLRWTLWGIVFLQIFFLIMTLANGGFSLKAGPISVSSHNIAKQALFIMTIFILATLAAFIFFFFRKNDPEERENSHFFLYAFLTFWALLLSFGRDFTFMGNKATLLPMPFRFFFNHVPGFKGIRVPSRYGILVAFGLVVLAGYGAKYLFDRIRPLKFRPVVAVILVLLVNMEFLSIPQRMRIIPVGKKIPPTYNWIAKQEGDFAVADLPFLHPLGKESVFMYFSIFHRKKLVNGYSGYIPPATDYIRSTFAGFPSNASIDILRAIDVKYIIIHPKFWNPDSADRKMLRLKERFSEDLKFVKRFTYDIKNPENIFSGFGDDWIYEVLPREPYAQKMEIEHAEEIPSSQWKVEASLNENLLHKINDGDLETRWDTGRAKNRGDFLVVHFDEPVELAKISLFLGRYNKDFAVDLKVEASLDGREWIRINENYSHGDFTLELIHTPRSPVQSLYLRRGTFKSFKIIQLGNVKGFWWSVAELKLYKYPSK